MVDSPDTGNGHELLAQFTKPNLDDITARARAWLHMELLEVDPSNLEYRDCRDREQRTTSFELIRLTLGEKRLAELYNRVHPQRVKADLTLPEYIAVCAVLGKPMASAARRTVPTIEGLDDPHAEIVRAGAFASRSELGEITARYWQALPGILGRVTPTLVVALCLSVTGVALVDRQAARTEIASLEQSLQAQRVERAETLVAEGMALLRTGNHGDALRRFERARDHAAAWRAAEPDSADAVYHAAQPEFWIAETYRRDGIEPDLVRAGLEAYAAYAARLQTLEPGSVRTAAERAYAALNLAGLAYRDRDFEAALTGFLEARDATRRANALDPSVMGAGELANAEAWLADTQFALGDIEAAIETRRAQLQRLATAGLANRFALTAERALIDLLILTGQTQEAAARSDAALASAEAQLAADTENLQLRRRQIALLTQRARIALADGQAIRAKLLSDRAMAMELEGRADMDRITGPQDAANLSLVAAEVALAFDLHDTAIERARQTLRYLDEIEGERALVATRRAEAHDVLGQALSAEGLAGEAEREWRRGLAAIDPETGHILERAVAARLLFQIGREREALALRQQLSDTGFSEPRDQAFWAEIGGRASTQIGDLQ